MGKAAKIAKNIAAKKAVRAAKDKELIDKIKALDDRKHYMISGFGEFSMFNGVWFRGSQLKDMFLKN